MGKKTRRFKSRSSSAFGLIEAVVCFAIFVPLTLLGADMAVLYNAAQVNEEFSEQLARLCSTLPDKSNANKACQDLVRMYKPPPNILEVGLISLDFDLGMQTVTVTTSMEVKPPFPFPGFEKQKLVAKVVQPIVSVPTPE